MPEEPSASLVIRVPAPLKAAFEAAAKREDRTVSQLIRDYMRAYVRDHSQLEFEPPTKPRKRP